MSESQSPPKPPRPPYQKPEVTKVRLDTEVLLASGCKTTAGSAKSGGACHKSGACVNHTAGS